MSKMLKRVKNSKGYVSIETIVVAGLVIGVGVVAFMAFQDRANTITQGALNQVETATNDAIVDPVN